jgi:putative redox protein
METKIQFTNDRGENLVGNLHTPDRTIRYGIVLGHCFTCSRHTGILRQICQDLTLAGAAALRFDFSGNGQSEGRFEQSTYSQQISEMKTAIAYLQAEGVERIGLAGHSMGAVIALLTSVQVPQAKAICCMAGRLSGMDPERFLTRGQQDELQRQGRIRFTSRGRDLQMTSGFFADAEQFNLAQTIKRLRAPLLIVHGDQDEIIPVDEAHRAHGLNSAYIQLEIVAGADHMFSRAEQRRAIASTVVAWFDRHLDNNS